MEEVMHIYIRTYVRTYKCLYLHNIFWESLTVKIKITQT